MLELRPLERLIEGGYSASRALDRDRRHFAPRRLLKYAVYAALAAILGNTFLAYFVGTDQLFTWMRGSPLEHPTGVTVVAVTTLGVFLDFTWFREQTCLVACPYGRWQSALLDKSSLVVAYDYTRGEPRAKGTKRRAVASTTAATDASSRMSHAIGSAWPPAASTSAGAVWIVPGSFGFYPAEHLIVDGDSTDGTMRIVRGFGSAISKVVSEPDRGVYDALNKGISLATGEVIGVLHGDVLYADAEVLSRVSKVFEDERIDSCYRDLDYVDPGNTDKVVRRWRSGPYDARRFYWGWMPPHPAFFVWRKIYEKYGLYNLTFGTAADYELMLRFLVKYRITSVYIPATLVKVRTGGMSNISMRDRLRANRMDRRAWRENGLKPFPFTRILKPLSKVGQFFVTGPGG